VGVKGELRKLRNQNPNNVYSSRNINTCNAHEIQEIQIRFCIGKRRLRRKVNNFEVVQREVEHDGMKWIYLVQKWIPRPAFENTVVNVRIL
jgi:hypothetical protein